MMETIMIPYVDPSIEVISAYPIKLILHHDRFEFYSKTHYISTDEDTDIKKERNSNYKTTVRKSCIEEVQSGASIKHPDKFVVNIYWTGREENIFFDSKADADALYTKLNKWIYGL